MRKFNLIFAALLLFIWATPAFAAVTEDTSVITIQGNYSLREPVKTLLGAATTVQSKSSYGAGAKNGSTVTAAEYGDGNIHVTTLTLVDTPLTVRDTEQGVGVKVYDFPEGRVLILGATGSMAFTTTSELATTLNASVSSRWGVGTVTQSNATLATTEQDIIPVTTFTSGATIDVENTAVAAALAASAQFDGTTTAKDAFLNVSVPGATDIDADATVTAAGTVTITWINLGDY